MKEIGEMIVINNATVLQEVIDLTKDVIKTQSGVEVDTGSGEEVSKENGSKSATATTSEATTSQNTASSKWIVGEKCLAIWSEDGS